MGRRMIKLGVGLVALAAMGCQQGTPPPSTPQAGSPPGQTDQAGPRRGAPHARGEGRGGAHERHQGRRQGQAHGRREHDGPARRAWGPKGAALAGREHGPEVMQELAELGVRFYPPQTILRHAKEIGLTPEQATKIRDEMLATRKRAIDLRAKIQHARLEAARLLAADKVDERAAGAQIDEAAKAQAELQKLHVAEMVRVRAVLSPEQRQKLDEKRTPSVPPRPRAGVGALGQADDGLDDGDEDEEIDDEIESAAG